MSLKSNGNCAMPRPIVRLASAGRAAKFVAIAISCTRCRRSPLDSDWETEWDGSELRLPDGSALSLRDEGRFAAPLRVRNRRGGERIKPAGHSHHRELRLLLQESGIPPWTRIHLPLIFEGNELIGVADMVLSERGHALVAALGTAIVWTSTTPRAPLIRAAR